MEIRLNPYPAIFWGRGIARSSPTYFLGAIGFATTGATLLPSIYINTLGAYGG